jgi:hypothetical protein
MSTITQRIYKGQTEVLFVIPFTDNETGDAYDLTDLIVKFKYAKPSGITGEWAAVVNAPATAGIASYKIPLITTLDEAGTWSIQGKFTYPDGDIAYSGIETFTIYNTI